MLSDAQASGLFPAYAEQEPYHVAQQEAGVSAPPVSSSVSKAGDALYFNATVETGRPLQAAGVRRSSGEDEELTVMRVLWDLYDQANADDMVDGRQRDRVSLGYDNLIKLLVDKKVLTLAQLWQTLGDSALTPGAALSVRKMADFGGVFQLNNVSPRPVGIKINGLPAVRWSVGDSIPEFVWEIPTGWPGGMGFGAVANLLDRFSFIVFDDSNQILLQTGLDPRDVTINGNSAAWQPNAAQWQLITRSPTTQLHWIVAGSSSATALRAFGGYWSDALSFPVQL